MFKSQTDKLKKHVDDNFPLYTYASGVAIGAVCTLLAVKPQMLHVAARGYNLAMLDIKNMVENGVDLATYFDALEKTHIALPK